MSIITLSGAYPPIEGYEFSVGFENPQSKKITFFDPAEDIVLFEIQHTASVEGLRTLLEANKQVPITFEAFFHLTRVEYVGHLLARWDPFRKREHEVSALCLSHFVEKERGESVLTFECELNDMYRAFFSAGETFHNGDVVVLFNLGSKRIQKQLLAA